MISRRSAPAVSHSTISSPAAAPLCSPASPAAPGEVRTEQFDIDLKRRNGQSLPVRLLHRVAFGQDGVAGASRTLVFNRAPGEEPAEDLRAAEVRFARVFNCDAHGDRHRRSRRPDHALQRRFRQA